MIDLNKYLVRSRRFTLYQLINKSRRRNISLGFDLETLYVHLLGSMHYRDW